MTGVKVEISFFCTTEILFLRESVDMIDILDELYATTNDGRGADAVRGGH